MESCQLHLATGKSEVPSAEMRVEARLLGLPGVGEGSEEAREQMGSLDQEGRSHRCSEKAETSLLGSRERHWNCPSFGMHFLMSSEVTIVV